MGDLVDDVRRQLDERITELRPLVAEHDRIVLAVAALGGTAGSPPARRGQRAQQALGFVKARPGLDTRELSDESGIPIATLYKVLRDLRDDGFIVKRARGWNLASNR